MKRFDLQELVDPVMRAFPAKSRLLDPAKRRHLDRHAAGVAADHAKLEPLGHTPGAPDVLRVEVRGEAIWRAVGHFDRLVFAFEAEERRDRTERLFIADAHLGLHSCQHGRRNEMTAERMRTAAYGRNRSARTRILDVTEHLLRRRIV